MIIYKVTKQSAKRDSSELGEPSELYFTSRRKADKFICEYLRIYSYHIRKTSIVNDVKIDEISPMGESFMCTLLVTEPVFVQ